MVISHDYTRLKNRENRIWEMGGYSLPGISTTRIGFALPAAALGAGLTFLVSRVVSNPWAILICALVLCGGLAALGYWLGGRPTKDGVSPLQAAMLEFDYQVFQPRQINGFTRDTEPDRLEWQVIMWSPTEPEWLDAYATFTAYYRAHLEKSVASGVQEGIQ